MLILISPAKKLDYDTPVTSKLSTKPEFLKDSQVLIDRLRQLSSMDLAELMKLSMNLAELNFDRYAEWTPKITKKNAKQALLAFKGDVYAGMDAESFSEDDLAYAQEHLRILSGLYGLLKPMDLMMAYRLEMGTSLENSRGKNLYEFWGSVIAEKLNTVLAEQDSKYLVNLASNEYFKAVDKKALNTQIITPHFKDCKNGQYKVISFYAKKARGMMARYIIENKITQLSELKDFTVAGYYFSSDATAKELEPVFLREEQN